MSLRLSAKVLTSRNVKFNDTQLVQIKLNDDVSLRFDYNVDHLPVPVEYLVATLHIINCMLEVSLKDIYTIRLHSGDANARIPLIVVS